KKLILLPATSDLAIGWFCRRDPAPSQPSPGNFRANAPSPARCTETLTTGAGTPRVRRTASSPHATTSAASSPPARHTTAPLPQERHQATPDGLKDKLRRWQWRGSQPQSATTDAAPQPSDYSRDHRRRIGAVVIPT